MLMSTASNHYKHLARKPKSSYKQLFVKDRWVSARTLYGQYVNAEEPQTAIQLAADYGLPLDAVLEAIAYCESNPPEIREDWEMEERMMDATGMNDPDYDGRPRILSPREWAELKQRCRIVSSCSLSE